MKLFQELNDEGVTIILVTHEDEVARYAKRIVELRDGKIIRDVPQEPDSAADDLAELVARGADDPTIEELETADAD